MSDLLVVVIVFQADTSFTAQSAGGPISLRALREIFASLAKNAILTHILSTGDPHFYNSCKIQLLSLIAMATIILSRKALAAAQAELVHRTTKLRSEIQQDLFEASELGDLYRENNPFDVAVDRQRLNEVRIKELENIIQNALIQEDTQSDIVIIGVTVHLKDRLETIKIIQIVDKNSPEINPLQGKISVDSPLGAALIGTKVGERVKVKLADREVVYKIVKII